MKPDPCEIHEIAGGVPPRFDRVCAPVPPMLDEAIVGGGGSLRELGRLIAFFCVPETKDAAWFDGVRAAAGSWRAWHLWRDHSSVRRALIGYELGDTSSEASHWLLLDRPTRRVYAAPSDEVLALTRLQWCPASGKHPCDAMAVQQIVGLAAVRGRARATPSTVISDVLDQDAVLGQMRIWLDRRPTPGQAMALLRMRNWRNQ